VRARFARGGGAAWLAAMSVLRAFVAETPPPLLLLLLLLLMLMLLALLLLALLLLLLPLPLPLLLPAALPLPPTPPPLLAGARVLNTLVIVRRASRVPENRGASR